VVVISFAMRMERRPRSGGSGTDRELAELTGRQHGVVSIRQLLGPLGYSQPAVSRAAAAGRLHPLHQGVYAVGHVNLSLHGECLAAVLGGGPEALLSHYSAGWLWGLTNHSPAPFHVTGPQARRARPTIRIHRSRTLAATDRRMHEGIPVTSVARTLLDQAALVPDRNLRRLLKRAEERKLIDLAAVRDVLGRNRGHHGARRLRLAIALYEPPPFTRSEFEARFFEAVRSAGLPTPRVNCNLAGMEVDLHWPDHRFVVELDLFETHGTRDSFEDDRLHQEHLLLEGVGVTRVTGPRFEREPDAVLARLGRLLAERTPGR
jgi:predicted transcriptional regulator of viral defense system/very-short-patch-repair endonuclease